MFADLGHFSVRSIQVCHLFFETLASEQVIQKMFSLSNIVFSSSF